MPIDGRAVNGQLQKAYAEQAALAGLARTAVRVAAPRDVPPGCGLTARGTTGPGGLTGWLPVGDKLCLWATDAGGTGTIAGAVLALLVKGLMAPADPSPAAVLNRVNRALLDLTADPPPLVGLGVVVFDPATGEVAVARGGVPAAVVLRAAGEPEEWHGPAPFLGAFAADFSDHTGTLHPGDMLLLATRRPTRLPARLPADGLAYTVAAAGEVEPGGCAAVAVGFP